MTGKTRKLTTLAVLAVLAYVITVFIRFPITALPFLKYDPKDVVILIGGFLFGPGEALMLAIVVPLLEMITVSTSGPIGFLMNALSTAAIACPAAFIYSRKKNITGAALGLFAGIVLSTGVMLLWNYFITPYYTGMTREAVEEILIPYVLPFNLIKGLINAALTLILYKPIRRALDKARLLPAANTQSSGSSQIGIVAAAAVILSSCVFLVLILRGIL